MTKDIRLQLKRDTAANWTTNDPVLKAGEMGIESDTRKFKFGDGVTTWTQLNYASSDAGNIPTKVSELENDLHFVEESEVAPIEDALKDNKKVVPTNTQKGVVNLGSGETSTKVVVTANQNYDTYTYKVAAGQQLTIKTQFCAPVINQFPIYVFAKDDETVVSKKSYNKRTNACQLVNVNETLTVPENATKLYVSSNYTTTQMHPAVYLGEGPAPSTPLEETLAPLTATTTWDSYFNFKTNQGTPTKEATSTLYRCMKFDVSAYAGKEVNIKTFWYSGALNIPLICFAAFTNTSLKSLYYEDFATEIAEEVTLDMDIVVPANATTLYVNVRPADVDHPEVECKVSGVEKEEYLSVSDVVDNVEMLKTQVAEVASASKYKIKLAFIGNSLTQDAVAYVPWILDRLAPDVDYEIWMWYNGGYTLERQLEEKWNVNGKAEMVSNWKKGDTKWTTQANTVTMQQFLANGPFDVVSMQEYFNYKTKYDEEDLQVYNDCLNYIRNNLTSPFYLVELLHQPHQTCDHQTFGHMDVDERYNFLLNSTKIMWNNLPIQSIIPTGMALYHAKDTILHPLGTTGDTYYDTTHAQEGIGCQMLGWITSEWILRHIGYPGGVLNDPTPITSSIQSSLNIPGANGSVVTGSTEQYRKAQELAANALKECDEIFGTQKAKTSDLDNDAGFVPNKVETEGLAITQVMSARKYSYDEKITGNLMPWTLFAGNKLADQRLYSIGFDVAEVDGAIEFGFINKPSATGMTERVGTTVFSILPTQGYNVYKLDGTDSRVTINSTYLKDGFPAIPANTTFAIVAGSGPRTFNSPDARLMDQRLFYINSSNKPTLSDYEAAFNINIVTDTNSTTEVKKENNSETEYLNYAAKVPTSINSAHWKTASAGSAPYSYYNVAEMQDSDVVSVSMGCLTTGATVKFWIGRCNGSTSDYFDYSVPLKHVFDVTLANTAYTEYKLDGTDTNVVLDSDGLTDGKVHIGENEVLVFSEMGSTNQFAYVSLGDTTAKSYITEDQWFVGTNGWTETTSLTKSGMNVGINVNKKKKVVSQSNPLKGKKLSLIGDSISTYAGYIPDGYAIAYPKWDVVSPEDTWWMKVIKKGEMVLGQNCAWSGSKVCGVCTGDSAEAACSDQRIKDLALNGTPDIVVCFIGTNDIGNAATMGNWKKGDAIPANTGTKATMSEAYALMVAKIMQTYPMAQVFCCSIPERKRVSGEAITEYPMVSNGLTLYDFNDMVKDVCDALGATYIDLHGCGMTWWNAESYCAWEEKGALHPNKRGMELFAKCVYSAIANFYEANRGE